MADKRREDQAVDRMSEDSFPASDPPSTTPPGGTRAARELHEAQAGAPHAGAGEAEPKGHPTSERYAQETTAARQSGVNPPEGDKTGANRR
ncbi:conserved protein of unknown function [Rhodovastum atsumiense]|uniref:Uncharacterized protein n=1 Tax=Rhodovastum atsumiense TaxID=504468 RepID=A0A5M6IWE7_9PROT|nr:hypothetical protein [Rhodovastum atsumiense]KAA5611725.1 hypothetical protein F1189_13080 [Rhodovastum atsumiense]CAH2604303.1 conserved protein of unknown function [Rhodovastum atsumiense]